MVKYRVIKCDNIGDLMREIDKCLADGWELQGGVSMSYRGINGDMYCQAITNNIQMNSQNEKPVMKEELEIKEKLDMLVKRQRHVILNYCNTVGCDGCMYNTYDSNKDCKSIRLQNNILELEQKLEK